jgi:predicted dehydrogenase
LKYHWAIVGCGNIANEMAKALRTVNEDIYAVGGHTPSRTKAFAKRFGIPRIYDDCDKMLLDPNVDIVYIATPYDLHYNYMKKAVCNGKHVLCEKAITVNARQLEEVRALAVEKGVVVMEAMTIYHMPLYIKLRELIDSGTIGKVKMLQANFGITREFDSDSHFFRKELGGGALLDFGVYAASFSRWFLQESPDVVLSVPEYSSTGIDEQSAIIFKNRQGQMGVMALTMCAKHPQRAVGMVSGEKGYIEVSDYPRADKALLFRTEDNRTEEIVAGKTENALQYEISDMRSCVAGEQRNFTLPLSGDVMALLTKIRNQWGMVYPFE